MTPHPQRCLTCDSCNHAEKTNSKIYPVKCRISKPVPMMVHEYCISWFQYVGCASHSSAQSEQEIRERVLDEATELLFEQFKKFTNEKYIFGTDRLADWWIERVGYLRTPEGQAELRSKQGEQE